MFPNPRRRFSRLQIKVISAKSNKTTCINLFKQRRRMKSFNFIPVYHGTFFIYGQLSWDLWEHIHKENILNKFVVGITQKQKLTTQKRKEKFVGNNENVIAAGAEKPCPVVCNLLDMFCYVVTTFNADCKIPQSNKMLSKFVPRFPPQPSQNSTFDSMCFPK